MKYFSWAVVLLALTTFAFADETDLDSIVEEPRAETTALPENCAENNSQSSVEGEQTLDLDGDPFNGADGQKVYQSGACDPCRNACAAANNACKAACGWNFQCIYQCSCDFYWCVDACHACGDQDQPPAGC